MKGSGNIAWIGVRPPGCVRAMAAQKIAASGAPRGERADRKARAAPRKRGMLVRLSALHSPHFCEEAEKATTAYPAPPTTRAA